MELDRKTHKSANLLKNGFNKKFCLANDKGNCSKTIINSHTISKSFLKNIAEDNHVITPEGNIYNEMGIWKLKSKGIKKAKGFKGFCSYHDNKLFSSFEKRKFVADKQQLFDLSFRSVCRELYQKKCLIYFIEELAEKYPDSRLKDTKNKYLTHTQEMIKGLKYLYKGIQRKYRFFTFIIKTTSVPINTAGSYSDQLISYLIQAFLFFNDIFVIRPSWYNNQDEEIKGYIEEVMNIQNGNYTGFNYVTTAPNFVPLFDNFEILDKKNILL